MIRKPHNKLRIRDYYRESWNYIKESKNYIFFAFIIFLFFAFIGFIFPNFFVEQIKLIIAQLLKETEGLNTPSIIGFIFFNNLKASFFGLALGVLFGFIPIVLAVVNGYVLGFVSNYAVKTAGFSSLFRLLPHGIFELPAIMISLGLGVKLGMFFFSRNSDKEFMRRIWLSLKVFILVIIPLLIIAAIIEGCLIGMTK
jgi:stage II sporulation protein M